MRELTSHRVNGLNESLEVRVWDDPGQGNACHDYRIDLVSVPGASPGLSPNAVTHTVIRFQNGPIQESGLNGLSNEVLLAIVEDRLIGFQSGQFACRENAVALTKLQECLMWLQKRTRDRMARGVEGTNTK